MKKSRDSLRIDIINNADRWKWQILIGIPTLGQVRIEWASALAGTIMPMNFSTSKILVPISMISPLNYHVAEAQNIIVQSALNTTPKFDHTLMIEDDVIVPPDIFLRLSKWVKHGVYPMVSGLYNLKSDPPEPMTFRGKGSGAYEGWKKGPGKVEREADMPQGIKPSEVVFCDGIPTGCLLISNKLLQVAWDESPPIMHKRTMADGSIYNLACRAVFETVREAGQDPETGCYYARMGTSDLEFCDDIIRNKWLEKAGFKKAAKMRYPFPVDLGIKCGHINLSTGKVY